MREITITRAQVNTGRLHEELKAAIADRFDGIRYNGREVVVCLHDHASAADEATCSAAVAAHDETQLSTAETTRNALYTLAQTAVGMDVRDLDNAQRLAVLAVLLWKAGAIDKSGVVQPFNEWLTG